MRLYHYTANTPCHLGSILETGEIRTTESNISFHANHVGPDVVWLTDLHDPRDAVRGGLYPLKTTARITVEVADAIPWRQFAMEHGMSRDDRRRLDRAGGGQGAHWFVVPWPVRGDEWLEVATADELGLRYRTIPFIPVAMFGGIVPAMIAANLRERLLEEERA
jgi:hypothetical protein